VTAAANPGADTATSLGTCRRSATNFNLLGPHGRHTRLTIPEWNFCPGQPTQSCYTI
jgi:hypothetical protein